MENRRIAICPMCGEVYYSVPALSRRNNKDLICPDCGVREALIWAGIDINEQEQIIEAIHSVKETM